MEILYHTIVAVTILTLSPFIVLRMGLDASFRSEILARFRGAGSLPPLKECIWIHASSVGEVRAAGILIRAMKKAGESRPIVLSTFTTTGYEQGIKENPGMVFRLPFDFPLLLTPLFQRINPSLLILIEAEFWPSLLRQCKRRGIPVLLANGRMSERAFTRYRGIRPLFHWIVEAVTRFSMRSQADAERILALGVSPEKVIVTGNIKFDALPEKAKETGSRQIEHPPLIVFGSTRPGDEGPVLEAILKLRETIPDLNCVLAPRHLQRQKEVEGLIQQYGLEFSRSSEHSEGLNGKKGSLLLLDQMGVLNRYFAKADLAFIGGGFNPRFGGQNILEPASHGIPVVFGRHMNNFEEEARLLRESGGGIQIDNPGDLYDILHKLLTDPEERSRRGRAAKEAIRANHGAVERNLQLIQSLS